MNDDSKPTFDDVRSITDDEADRQAVRNSTNRVVPGGYAQKSNRPPLACRDTADRYKEAVRSPTGMAKG